jgi:hypothetical protein
MSLIIKNRVILDAQAEDRGAASSSAPQARCRSLG